MSETVCNLEEVIHEFGHHVAFVTVKGNSYDSQHKRRCSTLEIKLEPGKIPSMERATAFTFACELQDVLKALKCNQISVCTKFPEKDEGAMITLRTDRSSIRSLQEVAGSIQAQSSGPPQP